MAGGKLAPSPFGYRRSELCSSQTSLYSVFSFWLLQLYHMDRETCTYSIVISTKDVMNEINEYASLFYQVFNSVVCRIFPSLVTVFSCSGFAMNNMHVSCTTFYAYSFNPLHQDHMVARAHCRSFPRPQSHISAPTSSVQRKSSTRPATTTVQTAKPPLQPGCTTPRWRFDYKSSSLTRLPRVWLLPAHFPGRERGCRAWGNSVLISALD